MRENEGSVGLLSCLQGDNGSRDECELEVCGVRWQRRGLHEASETMRVVGVRSCEARAGSGDRGIGAVRG